MHEEFFKKVGRIIFNLYTKDIDIKDRILFFDTEISIPFIKIHNLFKNISSLINKEQNYLSLGYMCLGLYLRDYYICLYNDIQDTLLFFPINKFSVFFKNIHYDYSWASNLDICYVNNNDSIYSKRAKFNEIIMDSSAIIYKYNNDNQHKNYLNKRTDLFSLLRYFENIEENLRLAEKHSETYSLLIKISKEPLTDEKILALLTKTYGVTVKHIPINDEECTLGNFAINRRMTQKKALVSKDELFLFKFFNKDFTLDYKNFEVWQKFNKRLINKLTNAELENLYNYFLLYEEKVLKIYKKPTTENIRVLEIN
jgi:hypothetical protein